MPWIIGDCDNMAYILEIWKNHKPIRLKKQYDSIVTARKICYEKMHKQRDIDHIDVIKLPYTICGYVHWAVFYNTDKKIVYDTNGRFDESGHYIRPDGSIYPTETNRRYSKFKDEKNKNKRKSRI